MRFILLLVLGFGFCLRSSGQPNCQAFLYMGDTTKYKACLKSEEKNKHYQFSRKFQMILDEALEIDPTFAYAYREKSVAYLKSGDFLNWKKLIDKAVQYAPEENLAYRGWCRYQFFRDYKGAIEDFERLDDLVSYEIGSSANGDYDLQIVRALCYSALEEKDKAIAIIEEQMAKEDYFTGKFDHLHLGVLYLKKGEYEKAIEAFKEQEITNDLAENHYYLALVYRDIRNYDKYHSELITALEMYEEGRIMADPYTHPYHKVYHKDIIDELATASAK